MTFDACTFHLTNAPFIECRLEAGSDDTQVDGRGLVVGAQALGSPHIFSAKNVVIGQSVLPVDNLTVPFLKNFFGPSLYHLNVPLKVKLV